MMLKEPLTDEFLSEVNRLVRVEIPHWLSGGTNFTSQLFTLIRKADPINKYKLHKTFPAEVMAVNRWEAENSQGLFEPGSITCHYCGKTSCNQNDAEQRYCASCGFYDETRITYTEHTSEKAPA